MSLHINKDLYPIRYIKSQIIENLNRPLLIKLNLITHSNLNR